MVAYTRQTEEAKKNCVLGFENANKGLQKSRGLQGLKYRAAYITFQSQLL